jgi:hypothetical protein
MTPLTPYEPEEEPEEPEDEEEDPEEPEEPEEPLDPVDETVPEEPSDDGCVENEEYTDDYGDNCAWYANNTESCGVYDNNSVGLTAIEACCACEGVVLNETTDPEEEEPFEPEDQCESDLSTSDVDGDSCEYYAGLGNDTL